MPSSVQAATDHDITFQHTKTWKESPDPDRGVKLDRIEQVITDHPDRTFAFDEFGPLAYVPTSGTGDGAQLMLTDPRRWAMVTVVPVSSGGTE